jgi:hypothetical protein
VERGDDVTGEEAVPEPFPHRASRDLARHRHPAFLAVLLGGGGNESPRASPDVDNPFAFQRAIRMLDRIRVHFQLVRQLPDGRERVVRLHLPDRDGAPNLINNLLEHGTRIVGIKVD